VSVTNVDLSGTVTLKMVKLTNLDLSLEHVHLWLSFHFRASIFTVNWTWKILWNGHYMYHMLIMVMISIFP